MALGFGASLIKYIFFILNFIFLLGGIGLMWLGGYVLSKISDLKNITNDIDNLNTFWVSIIVVGFFVFLIAFFGCFGAICESQCSLRAYAVVVSILILASIIVGLLAFNKISVIEKSVDHAWNQVWKNHNTTQKIINEIQKGLSCCGNGGPKDYVNLKIVIPPSCCTSDVNICNIDTANLFGCSGVLRLAIQKYGISIGIGSMVLAVIMIFAVSLICFLKSRIEYEQFV